MLADRTNQHILGEVLISASGQTIMVETVLIYY